MTPVAARIKKKQEIVRFIKKKLIFYHSNRKLPIQFYTGRTDKRTKLVTKYLSNE